MKLIRFGVLVAALVTATSAFAQQPAASWSLTAAAASCTASSAACGIQDVQGLGSVGVQITGTFVATIQFEQSIDGTNWVTWSVTANGAAAVTSTTTTGFWIGPVSGVHYVRVRVSAYTSGTAVVSTQTAQARLGVSPGSSPTFGPVIARVLTRSTYAFIGQDTDGTDRFEMYVGGTGNGNFYVYDNGGNIVAQLGASDHTVFGNIVPTAAGILDVIRSPDGSNKGAIELNPTYANSQFASLQTGAGITGVANNFGWKFLSYSGSADLPLLTLYANGQAAFTSTSHPACSSNCGTSPSVSGSDVAGRITMGATGSPASGWVATFAGTWASAPNCSVWMSKSGMVTGKKPIVVVTSTTTFTVTTDGTAPANSDTYDYHCFGTQ